MNYNEIIDEVNRNKKHITWAISLSIADGNKIKAKEYFNSFYPDIYDSNVFFLETDQFVSKYEQERIFIIKKLNSFLGYDTLPFIKGKKHIKIKFSSFKLAEYCI